MLKIISPLYHRVNGFPEFIVSTLKDLKMWEDIDFWLYFFFCDNVRRRDKLPENFRSSTDDWVTMDAAEREEACLKDETSLYNVIGEICYSVALVGISDAMFKNFIERCAILIRMNEKQTFMLTTFAMNIVNSNRASIEQANVVNRNLEDEAEKLFKVPKRKPPQLVSHTTTESQMESTYERLRLGSKKISTTNRDNISTTVYDLNIGEVKCLAVRDTTIVGGSLSGIVTVWDISEKRPFAFDFNTRTDGVSAVEIDKTMPLIFIGTRDCKAFVYNRSRRAIEEVFSGHKAQIQSICIHKKYFLSGSDDKALGVWNRETKGPFELLQGHAGAILCIKTIDAPRKVLINEYTEEEDHKEKEKVEGKEEEKHNTIWDEEEEAPAEKKKEADEDTTFAVTGSEDGSIRVWDLERKKCIIVLKGHCDWVTQLAIVSPTIILSKSVDRTVKVWDLEKQECVYTFGDENLVITAFAYNAGEVLAGCEDGTVIRWRLRNPTKPILMFKVVGSTVTNIKPNSDNSVILTSCEDGNIYMWNDTGNIIASLRGHTDTVNTHTQKNKNYTNVPNQPFLHLFRYRTLCTLKRATWLYPEAVTQLSESGRF